MRRDMNKVLTERKRAGVKDIGRKPFDKANTPREKSYYKDVELDDRPEKESMTKRHMYYRKSLTDHIQPLVRYLVSQVGRKWDDVWSDICKVMKGNGLQAQHVKDHVKDYVGGVSHSGKTYYWRDAESHLVYVDENGVLRKGRDYRSRGRNRKPKIYDHVRESDLVEYHKINGCWYRLTLAEYEVPAYRRYDGTWQMEMRYPVVKKEAISKRRANKLNLENRLSNVPPRFKA